MKAAVYTKCGPPDVLEIRDIAKPDPGDGQVLIQVRAAALNPLDWKFMNGKPRIVRLLLGVSERKPGRPGRDVAGVVEAVGGNVTGLKPGDEVFGNCPGAIAEYACAAEAGLVLKPKGMTFEQAASVPVAGYTALQGLRDKGRIRAGQKVLINGASGGVGTFAVQVAKTFGAEVTGVCSTRNLELVRSIGADHVIDYTQEDFTRSDRRYDLMFDCIGNHSPSACRRALEPRGIFVMVGGPDKLRIILSRILEALVVSRFVSQDFVMFIAKRSQKDLTFLGGLVIAGKITPVIDKCYRMDEVVEAMRHLETGHARGKVVITI
jgi:NADPH:quinone reductase-like Zn-dependent oxidoreductase